MGGILRMKMCYMPIEAQLALANYAGNLSQASLSEYQVIRHVVMPSVTKDSAKRHSTKRSSVSVLARQS